MYTCICKCPQKLLVSFFPFMCTCICKCPQKLLTILFIVFLLKSSLVIFDTQTSLLLSYVSLELDLDPVMQLCIVMQSHFPNLLISLIYQGWKFGGHWVGLHQHQTPGFSKQHLTSVNVLGRGRENPQYSSKAQSWQCTFHIRARDERAA